MTYTVKQSARMMRLYNRLLKIGYHYEGIYHGFGWTAIFTGDRHYVDNSEDWMWAYLDGKLSSSHIITALTTNVNPYDVAAASAERSRKRAGRHKKKGTPPPAPSETDRPEPSDPPLPQ